MFNKFPKRSGIYRIHDNIEQLQLRLQFRHINSLLKLPKFDLHKIAADDWRQRSTDNNSDTDDSDAVQTINIKWQQKILSTHEMEYYKEASNCVTERQKNYHAWLLAGGTAQVADPATLQNDDKPKSKKRSRKKEQLKPPTVEEVNHLEHIFTYINEDKHEPAEAAGSGSKQQHSSATTVVMFVYATLQSVDTLLIVLRWQADTHLLHIYPDFTCFHNRPYYIQVDADYSHLYAYGFENCSPSQAVDATLSNNSSNMLQLPQVPHWQSEQQLVSEFAMPPKRCRRIVLLLEIREARDFVYESLHVRYHVHLPSDALLEEGLLQASTQASAATRGTHHFGYCWQLTLLCEECEDFVGLCHIFFEVISIDSWQRERVEGFAYCAYTLQAAAASDRSHLHLRCLRPVDSFLDSLNRYFIGGRQCFDFERFFLGDPESPKPEENSEFHSRYGCRMQRTGELVVSCKHLTQRNCELLQPCMNNSSGMTLDDIMLAYREARKRLEEIALY